MAFQAVVLAAPQNATQTAQRPSGTAVCQLRALRGRAVGSGAYVDRTGATFLAERVKFAAASRPARRVPQHVSCVAQPPVGGAAASDAEVEKAIAALKAVSSPEELVRNVSALVAYQSPLSIPALREVFDCNNTPASRIAVGGLVALGAVAVPHLLETIDETHYGSRANSIRALAAIGDVRALERLWNTARTDQGPTIRRAAIRGMGVARYEQLEGEERVAAVGKTLDVLEELASDQDWAVRYAATAALQSLHAALPLAPALEGRWRAQLDALAADPDPVVRCKAALAAAALLGAPLSPAALRTAEAAGEADPDDNLLYRWGSSSGDGPDAPAPDDDLDLEEGTCLPWERSSATEKQIELAIETLRTADDPAVRYYYAWWLGRFRAPQAVDALVAALDDADASVRKAAARSLGSLGKGKAGRAGARLVALLESEDFHLREAAANSIGLLGLQEAKEKLIAILRARPADDRPAGGASVLQGGDAQQFDLSQYPPETRAKLEAIFKAKYQATEAKQGRSLYEDSEEPYDAVVRALAALGATEAADLIRPLTAHPQRRVRYAAARAMYVLKGEVEFVEQLLAALSEEPDFKMRRLVALTIAGLPIEEAPLLLRAARTLAASTAEPLFKAGAVYSLACQGVRRQAAGEALDAAWLADVLEAIDAVV